MDKKLAEELKNKLETEKNSITKELESFATEDPDLKHNWETKYPNVEDGDRDEEANEVQDYDNMLSVEHNLEIRLKNVVTALEKMDLGTYGVCENCGKKIEEERLRAMPEARTCLSCNK